MIIQKSILFSGFLLAICTANAQFTTEINPDLTAKVWKAQWIKHPNTNEHYGVYNFRKVFDLAAAPIKFVIHVSADNRYWLYVNGKRICTGPAKGDVAHWRFESLDIASYLKEGKNILAAEVWNHGDYRAASQDSYGTGLLVQGNTDYESIINTNESWKVVENTAYFPILEDNKYLGAMENFFAARYPTNWEKVDFNDKIFVNAITGEPGITIGVQSKSPRRLVQRNIPLTEEIPQQFANVRRMEK